MTTLPIPAATASNIPPRILVIGGGYVGMYTARRILKKLKRGEAIVTVVDPRAYMTYQPFLPEAAAGSIAPRNIVAPLRRVLTGPNAEVITGRVTSVDHSRNAATIMPNNGDGYELSFDHLIVAVGSVPRTLPIPGLAEHGIGFKQVEEAISLRNHVIGQIDLADSIKDPAARLKALTFVFVGGGFAGVEAIARDGGHGPGRVQVVRERRTRGPALAARRGGRPDPARGRPRTRRVDRRGTAQARHPGQDEHVPQLLRRPPRRRPAARPGGPRAAPTASTTFRGWPGPGPARRHRRPRRW